jgi:alkylated DNA repair dioxygenase AlkB
MDVRRITYRRPCHLKCHSGDLKLDLFAATENFAFQEPLGPGAILLRKFCQQEEQAKANAAALLRDLAALLEISPLRHMVTRRFEMSVAMSNCGALGWVTDHAGYYQAVDPKPAALTAHASLFSGISEARHLG